MEFKTNILEIKPGKKDSICIPKIFKVNDIGILCALVRGYFDADGSLYFKSQNKNEQYYPRISAASISKELIEDFIQILGMLGFNVKTYKDKDCYSIVLNGYSNFERYNKLIGWSNPKHLKKIKRWSERNPKIANNYMATVV